MNFHKKIKSSSLFLLIATLSFAQAPFKIDHSTALETSFRFEDSAQINAWLKNTLQVNEHTSFVLESSFTDKLGFTHYKYHQMYRGYKVQDALIIIHTKDQRVRSINGEIHPDIQLEPQTFISQEEAIEIGQQTTASEKWAWEEANFPQPEVFVIATEEGFRYTYKMDIYSYAPLSREWVFVDVASGEVLEQRNRIQYITVPGEAHCFYSGLQTINVDSLAPNEFVLRDYSRGDGIITLDLNGESDFDLAVDLTDDDNIWDTITDAEDAALDVHWATSLMYDYMLDTHAWSSFDNQSSAILSYTNFSNNFNAFWSGDAAVYGNGDGSFFNPLTAPEIVGHELMHGYSSSMVDFNFTLIETLALNEAYSDIFSFIVESNISPSTANYTIGDMVTVSGAGLRSLENPNAFEHPDTYLGEFWDINNVNNVSGIINFSFYLLTQGGSDTNDNGDDYLVEPIAQSDAADILFRALSVYMTPSVNFLEFRAYGIQACIDLYGPCSIQEIQFTNACYAVGLGDEYVGPPISEIQAIEAAIVEEEVVFSSNATDAISWNWNFGDGNNSSAEMPTHVFESPGDFEVVLSATYPGGCVMTDIVTVTITDITAVEDLVLSALKVYPNPTSRHLNIEFSDTQRISQVRIINALGQEMGGFSYQHISPLQASIQLDNIPAGVYFMTLKTEDSIYYHQKFSVILE